MIYVISKYTTGDYNVRDIQCNANWDCCPYSDYALIPDNLAAGILGTKGYCEITLNDDKNEVVSFTAREIPDVPEDCCGERTATEAYVNARMMVATDPNNDGNIVLSYGGSVEGGGSGTGTGGGTGTGKNGEDGGYYVPTVNDGVLNWTPSKAGMPAVPSANICSTGGGVSSWNDLTDKPFGETVFYEYDKDKEYTDVFDEPSFDECAIYVKISDETPDKAFFVGKALKIEHSDGTPSTMQVLDDSYIFVQDGMIIVAFALFVLPAEFDFGDGKTLSPGIWAMVDRTNPYSIQLCDVNTINEGYIPDTIARVSDGVEWNMVKDKPFGNEAVLYEYDENEDYVDSYSVTSDDGTTVLCVKFGVMKYGEHPPESDYFIGKYLFIRTVSGDETVEITSDIITQIRNGVYSIGAVICVVDTALYENGPIALSRGIWALLPDTLHVTNIRIYDEPQPLNEKYIPDTIARTADVQTMIDNAIGGTGVGGSSITAEEVQTMIDNSLGVIENATY